MKNIFKRDYWTDPVKWGMDFLKNSLTFLLATLVTVLFVKQCDRRQFEWQSQYGYKLLTLKEFEKNSSIYLRWSFDAFSAACHCKQPETNDRMRGWMDEGYDDFNYSLESIGTWFSSADTKSPLKLAVDSLTVAEDEFRTMHTLLLSSIARKGPSFCQNNDSMRLFWDDYKHRLYFPKRKKMVDLRRQVLTMAQKELIESY